MASLFYDQPVLRSAEATGGRGVFEADHVRPRSTIWPLGIGLAIATIEEERDIPYNNAARFLRLSREEVAKEHAR